MNYRTNAPAGRTPAPRTPAAPRIPVLTASEFIAQGTTAGAIMSFAAGRPEIEAVAREVAAMTGTTLLWPGQATVERERERRIANDNRRAGRRVAA